MFLITTVASKQHFAIILPAHSTLGLFLHSNKASGWKKKGKYTTNHPAVSKIPAVL